MQSVMLYQNKCVILYIIYIRCNVCKCFQCSWCLLWKKKKQNKQVSWEWFSLLSTRRFYKVTYL